jgi:Kef-type K+ transport system membrane component KefB
MDLDNEFNPLTMDVLGWVILVELLGYVEENDSFATGWVSTISKLVVYVCVFVCMRIRWLNLWIV